MTRRPFVHGVLAVALLVGLGFLAGCTGGTSPSPAAALRVFTEDERKAAPQFTGDLLDGSGTYKVADHLGEVVVVNFWASWCGPCVGEAEEFEATYQATRDDKVSFIGVNMRDLRDPATSFLIGRTTYPNVFDPSGKIALGFAVAPTAIPTTIVLDRKGRIAAIASDSLLQRDLEPVVTDVASESM
jgi:thiol-disulfide isomerase/thioredoxin